MFLYKINLAVFELGKKSSPFGRVVDNSRGSCSRTIIRFPPPLRQFLLWLSPGRDRTCQIAAPGQRFFDAPKNREIAVKFRDENLNVDVTLMSVVIVV